MADGWNEVFGGGVKRTANITGNERVPFWDEDINDRGSMYVKELNMSIGTWNVALISDNGVPQYYKATEDTNEARGIALKSAVEDAESGDKIYVRAGTYDCADLFVDGAYFYFEDGAIINYTGTTNARIFDITSGSGILNIDGYGQFIHQGNDAQGQVVYSKQSAQINVRCKKIQSVSDVAVYLSASDDETINMSLYADEVLSGDGTFDMVRQGTGVLNTEIHAHRAYSTQGFVIECDGGNHQYYINEIECLGSAPVTIASDGYVKVYNATIKAEIAEFIAETSSYDYDRLEFYNCIFDTEKDVIFEGKSSVLNCVKTDETELKSNASILYLGSNITHLTEKSSDPTDPAEGNSVMWQSDGTGSGDDGDIMMKITVGATTKTVTLVDFSES